MQIFNAILSKPNGDEETLLLGAGGNNHAMDLKIQEGNAFWVIFESNTAITFTGKRIAREEVLENDKLVELIAETCHRNNKIYCETIGDNSQKSWDKSPDWQKNSAIKGVIEVLKKPDIEPETIHEEWKKNKESNGWKYGKEKDPKKKEHPCIVPYSRLPEEQRNKDTLFITTVNEFFSNNDPKTYET